MVEEGFGALLICKTCEQMVGEHVDRLMPPKKATTEKPAKVAAEKVKGSACLNSRAQAREKKNEAAEAKKNKRTEKSGPLVHRTVAFIPEEEVTPKGDPWITKYSFNPSVTSLVIYGILKAGRSNDTYIVHWHDRTIYDSRKKSNKPEIVISTEQAQNGINRFNMLQQLPEVEGVDMMSLHTNRDWEPFMGQLHDDDEESEKSDLNIDDEDSEVDEEDIRGKIQCAEMTAIKREMEDLKLSKITGALQFDTNCEPVSRAKNLYEQQKSKVVSEHEFHFKGIGPGSSARAFFAFVPLSFWRTVVLKNMNEKRIQILGRKSREFQLGEVIQFIGLLLHMKIRHKGSYRNHWDNAYDKELGAETSLFKNKPKIMRLSRFIHIRRCFCIVFHSQNERNDEEDSEDFASTDPLWRVRPLLNIVKQHSKAFMTPGRNVCVDEASVAARSKFANFLIFYNPKKPCGKYHFKFYILACGDEWYMLNFIVHCDSTEVHRLQGVMSCMDIVQMERELEPLNRTTKIVMELARSLYGSSRILNTDNYYTSIVLASALRMKQLYLRGTVRSNSLYIPKELMIQKNETDSHERGFCISGYNRSRGLAFFSWNDGSPVNIISTVDGTEMAYVTRKIRKKRRKVIAPLAIKEYNTYMQAVDRHDQLRTYVAMGGGNSFSHWYKKFAVSVLDFVIVNAFTATKMVQKDSSVSHGQFVQDLALDLMFARYANDTYVTSCIPLAYRKLVRDEPSVVTQSLASSEGIFSPKLQRHVKTSSPSIVEIGMQCRTLVMKGEKRACIVCLFELGRRAYANVAFDDVHHVPLCLTPNKHPRRWPLSAIADPNKKRSCWDKYHFFYFKESLWITTQRSGKWRTQTRTGSDLWKSRADIIKRYAMNMQSNRLFPESEILRYE